MARYRTYKNGIFGHKHRGYYIIRGEEKGYYSICSEDNQTIQEGLLDFEECEWFIDKMVASDEELEIIRDLYEKEIFQLSNIIADLMAKDGAGKKDKYLMDIVTKIRWRKIKQREF